MRARNLNKDCFMKLERGFCIRIKSMRQFMSLNYSWWKFRMAETPVKGKKLSRCGKMDNGPALPEFVFSLEPNQKLIKVVKYLRWSRKDLLGVEGGIKKKRNSQYTNYSIKMKDQHCLCLDSVIEELRDKI